MTLVGMTGIVFLALAGLAMTYPLQQSAEERPICVYNNSTYLAGEKFKPDPCTFCHCPRHGGRAQCAIQDCQYEPTCVHRSLAEDACCGSCLQYGCRHSDGAIYQPGQTVSLSKCERCHCPPHGGAVECLQAPCPLVLNCVNPVQEDGECCPKCLDGPNCWYNGKIIPAGKVIKMDACRRCHCPRNPEKWPMFIRKRGLQAVCNMDCPTV